MKSSDRLQRRYLVTGVTGQLGMEMMRQFGDHLLPRTREICDLLSLNQLTDFMASVKPAAVLHAAGFTGFDQQLTPAEARDRLWHSNVITADNVAKACAKTGTPIVLVSCDQVFGGLDPERNSPFKEAAAAAPASHYGMTKIAAEHALFRLAHCLPTKYWGSGFKFWIVRVPFLLDRPWDGCRNPFTQALLLSRRRKEVVFLPSDIVCSPIYLPDLAKELFWLLSTQALASGLYHLGGSSVMSLAEAGCTVARCSICPTKMTVLPDVSVRCELSCGQIFRHLSKYSAMDCNKYQLLSGRTLPTAQQTLANMARDIDAFPL